MREKHVLSSTIKSRDAFMRVADHVTRDDLSEQGWVIWETIQEYYDNDTEAKTVDHELLTEAVVRRVSVDKHKDMFRTLVTSVCQFESSPANVVSDLLATKRTVVGHSLANALLTGEATEKLLEEYNDLLGREEFDTEADSEARRGMNVEELVQLGWSEGNMITVSPESLNRRLEGGVKPGHHLIIFARPEMGKTMMVIEMMAGFIKQGLTVLYVGNEDPINDVNMRVVNRLSGMNKAEVLANPKKADALCRKEGYENLILQGLAPGTPREITGLIEKYEPHVLVLDQLRNLNMSQENFVLKLENAATQARLWAKRYSCVVVSVTQAGDSASGKAILDLGDVDFSNTGIPAQADVMIGLGATKNNAMRGEIVVSLPKNKVSGDHSYFTLLANPPLSRLDVLD